MFVALTRSIRRELKYLFLDQQCNNISLQFQESAESLEIQAEEDSTETPKMVYRRPYSVHSSWAGRKRGGMGGAGEAGGVARNNGNGNNPLGGLSILDNIATLRKSLLRELAMRSMARDREQMTLQSENYKNQVG